MTDSQHPVNFPYLPHTKEDREEMLHALGKRSFEELVSQIPKELRASAFELDSGLSELELTQQISALAKKNKPVSDQISFLGGGSYHRYVPAVVSSVLSRSEFSTSYTPYQPEVSQGTLQTIYEFQTAICLLTQMDVANASMYDGPTACAEAAMMAARFTHRRNIIISKGLNPEYRKVTKTYVDSCGLVDSEFESVDGTINIDAAKVDSHVACCIVQYPNYFGLLEDLQALADKVHEVGAFLVVITDPISLGLLTPPGAFGADIVVGDAQSCGNFLSFGGPSAGFMACRKELVRQLPGRLAGMTVDNRGQPAFILTLQTREQHIRRAMATSNICTNQALNALAMLVYLASMGPRGMKQLATISVERAHYLAEKLCLLPAVKLTFNKPFFNEFAITLPKPVPDVLQKLKDRGILGGIDQSKFYPELKNSLLIAVTEMNTREQIDTYVSAMEQILCPEHHQPEKGTTKPSRMPATSSSKPITNKID